MDSLASGGRPNLQKARGAGLLAKLACLTAAPDGLSTAFKSPLRTSRDDTSRVGTRTPSTSTSHTIEWASQSCSTAS